MLQMTTIELCAVVLVGVAVAAPIGGAFIRRIIQLNRLDVSFFEETPLKPALTITVVMLGLLSWIVTPILSVLVLIGVAKFLPIENRVRASLLVIGCISIGLGVALNAMDLPLSQIAALKLLGPPNQAPISGIFGL